MGPRGGMGYRRERSIHQSAVGARREEAAHWHGIGAVTREETPNGEEVIRIISAREADPRERRIYLEQAPY